MMQDVVGSQQFGVSKGTLGPKSESREALLHLEITELCFP